MAKPSNSRKQKVMKNLSHHASFLAIETPIFPVRNGSWGKECTSAVGHVLSMSLILQILDSILSTTSKKQSGLKSFVCVHSNMYMHSNIYCASWWYVSKSVYFTYIYLVDALQQHLALPNFVKMAICQFH